MAVTELRRQTPSRGELIKLGVKSKIRPRSHCVLEALADPVQEEHADTVLEHAIWSSEYTAASAQKDIEGGGVVVEVGCITMQLHGNTPTN